MIKMLRANHTPNCYMIDHLKFPRDATNMFTDMEMEHNFKVNI